MLKTCAEIAKLKGVSRQAACKYLKTFSVKPSGKKGKLPTYDTRLEPVASYLGTNNKKEPPAKKKTVPAAAKPNAAMAAAAAKMAKPLNDLLAGKLPPGRTPAEVLFQRALALAEKNEDAALLFKLGQIADKEYKDEIFRLQMLKTEQAKEQIATEKAERLKIENDIRRGMYISLDEVKMLFGKTYAVHTSILTPLGLKTADMLDALPEGPGRRNKMQKIIDGEIYSALEMIKKQLEEYISG